jgi:hypothetical protein
MYRSKKYMLNSFANWNHDIFSFISDFVEIFNLTPNIALTNDPTLDRISTAMSTELIEKGKVNQSQSIGAFACDLGVVDFCIDRELVDREVMLVFDDEAEFCPDDGESSSYKPNEISSTKSAKKAKAS